MTIADYGQPVSFPIICPAGEKCGTFQVYRNSGACPATLIHSPGWLVLGQTSASQFEDQKVVSGETYSYDVEGVAANRFYSGPSDCITRSVE